MINVMKTKQLFSFRDSVKKLNLLSGFMTILASIFLPIYQCSRIDYFEAEDTAGRVVTFPKMIDRFQLVPAAVSPNPRLELYI